MATNISKVYLLNVPLEDDMRNTLYFSSANNQQTYFNNNIGKTYTNVSYQSEKRTFRCPDHIDNVRQYNYIMWQNTAYSNKWFYAFIKDMVYYSDQYTDVIFEVDPLQTYMFDIEVKPSFVEREHVDNDTIGLHTVPEGLETGEYAIVDKYNIPLYESGTPGQDWAICFCVTNYPTGDRINGEGLTVGGVFTSLHFFAVADVITAYAVIKYYDIADGITADAIKNVYMIPRSGVNMEPVGGHTTWTFTGGGVTYTIPVYPINDSATTGPFYWQQSDHLYSNYKPRNNKLFTYPFYYAYLSNKVGDNLVVHWEDFPMQTIGGYQARTIGYKKALVPSTSLSAKLYFINYKGYSEGGSYGERLYEYGINFAKAPVCAWTTDYYTNWLTQNGVNIATNITGAVASGGLAIASAALLGGPIGLAVAGAGIGLASAIGNSVAQQHQASVTPDNANGDVNAGDVMFAYNKCAISLYSMSIKPEYSQIIDSYFDMFGYKVNRLKVPNTNHRQNWWYTKTIGANIVGNVPNEYMNKIKEAYNNGLTYWKNPANFLNYSVSNGIV